MEIIEYEDKYLENVRDLLVELEEYILSIDKDGLDQLHPDYREKMALLDLENIHNHCGKCFLALDDKQVLGLIMGEIVTYNQNDYLDYKCPKAGEISELIVTSKTRSKGIGKALMESMESYFKFIGCEYILVNVFAYNELGKAFYQKQGFHSRMYREIKKIV